uniref:Cathepsin propeptide inhibitor domain-containing protein n=1 Tax=Aegilops tauschii subsp. strangulata TaxID=200361 RepID=A0A453F1U8_AEGTS
MAPIPSLRCLCGALLLLVFVVAAVVVDATVPSLSLAARHERWMAKFGRAYTDADEKLRRREVFAANVRHVDAVNRAGNLTYTLGLNQFSDLTDDEFLETHLGYRHQLRPEGNTTLAAVNVSKAAAPRSGQFQYMPDSVDWRAQGAVTQVKNQRFCGTIFLQLQCMHGIRQSSQIRTKCLHVCVRARRKLLGVRGRGGDRGAGKDWHRQPHLHVGATSPRLHGRRQHLQRRGHQRRTPLCCRQRRPTAGGGLRV